MGNVSSGSIFDFSRNGARSTKTLEVQNLPTLSVVNDETASGALSPPARSAWLILSSVMLPTTFTWMFGYSFSNASTFSWMALTSLGALQPCQNVIVTSSLGSSSALPLVLPVQALASNVSVAATAAAARIRFGRAMAILQSVSIGP